MSSTPMERAVRTWLTQLDVERGVSAHTLAAYTRDARRYVEHLADQGVTAPGDVTELHVSGFLASLRAGDDDHPPLAATSAARTLVAVRGMHKFLALEGETAHNPAQDVAPPAPPSRLPKAIGRDEVTRLIDAAGVGDGAIPLRDQALLEVLYGTGARISEAVGLDLDDLDLDIGAARLLGKGGKERVVPLGSYAVDAVRAWLVRGRPELSAKGKAGPALFLNRRGAQIGRAHV